VVAAGRAAAGGGLRRAVATAGVSQLLDWVPLPLPLPFPEVLESA
jgi:hypothetical protein